MKEQFAVKMGNSYICTIYKKSTSESDGFDDALKLDSLEDAKVVLKLAAQRNKGTSKEFSIKKRTVTFEDVEV